MLFLIFKTSGKTLVSKIWGQILEVKKILERFWRSKTSGNLPFSLSFSIIPK